MKIWKLLFVLGVPAKLPGFSGDPTNGSSVIHHGQGSHILHHHHLQQQQHQQQQQQQQQHQQQQAFSNGYHPHPHHLHHHAPPPLPPAHLRPNGSTFYGWHAANHNGGGIGGNLNLNSNAQHQQLPPPQVMAIVNKWRRKISQPR